MAWKLRDIFDGGLNALTKVTYESLTADPANLLARFFFRSDLSRASYYDGTAVRRIAHMADTLDEFGVPAAALNMGGFAPTNGATPVNPTDLAIKSYVDAVASGLDPRNSVAYAAAAAIPAYTYNNGASGVGATITATAVGLWTIDGQANVLGDRILLPDAYAQAASDAGLFVVTTVGTGSVHTVWTRAVDFNSAANILPGAYVLVESGATYKGSGFVMTQRAAITVGTTSILWTRFSAAGAGPGKFTETFGDGATNPWVIPHGLGTGDFTVSVQEVSTGDEGNCGVNRTSTDVTLTFSVIPTANQYRVTCIG